ncbi:hypothetical protein TNCV_3650121 [Trichonephila clavipes]|nr:hypothetical protein TNCV_3650121 [Trichonephila clavipes]
MNRCPDLVVCLKRDLQCLRPEASLVLIYRPNVAGMKGRVDLAQPVNRTPDLWCGGTIHYHSILFVTDGLMEQLKTGGKYFVSLSLLLDENTITSFGKRPCESTSDAGLC